MERSLSALIAVRNVESTLREAVLEMLEVFAELTNRFELVVIDDCSIDATIEVADELAAAYPQLRLMRHPVPRGRLAALATGLDRSVGQVVFFADEDCRLTLDPVRQLWSILDEHEAVLACPSARDGWLDRTQRPSDLGGGYQMGARRLFCELAYALGDQSTLAAELERLGIRWRRLEVSGEDRPRSALSRLALAGVRNAAADAAARSLRADCPGAELARAKHPNYALRPRQWASESY